VTHFVPRPFHLAALLVALIALRIGLSWLIPVPVIFPDELIYLELARNVAQGHGLLVHGEPTNLPTVLYPLLIAPLQAVADPHLAFRLVQAANGVAVTLVALPAYWLGRLVLPAPAAAGVAGLVLLAPYTLYSHFAMTESVFLLVVLGVAYATLQALLRPERRWKVLLGLLMATAAMLKPQGMLLPVVVGGTFLAAAWIDRAQAPGLWRRAAAFWPTAVILLGVAALSGLRMMALAPEGSGFSLNTLVGYYSRDAAGTHAFTPANFARAVAAMLGALALGSAFLPMALFVPFAWHAARRGTPVERLFAVFTVLLGGVLLVLAARHVAVTNPPQVHERYVFYLAPFLLIGGAHAAMRGSAARRGVLALAGGLVLLAAAFAQQAAGTYVDTPTYAALYRPQLSLGWPGTVALLVLGGLGLVAALSWLSARARWGAVAGALAAYTLVLSGFTFYSHKTLSTLYAQDLPFVGWVQGLAKPDRPIALVLDGFPYMPAMLTDVFSRQPIRMVYYARPMWPWLERRITPGPAGEASELSALPDGSAILAHRSVRLDLPRLGARGEVVAYVKRGVVRRLPPG
jgi:hypothetical protein